MNIDNPVIKTLIDQGLTQTNLSHEMGYAFAYFNRVVNGKVRYIVDPIVETVFHKNKI